MDIFDNAATLVFGHRWPTHTHTTATYSRKYNHNQANPVNMLRDKCIMQNWTLKELTLRAIILRSSTASPHRAPASRYTTLNPPPSPSHLVHRSFSYRQKKIAAHNKIYDINIIMHRYLGDFTKQLCSKDKEIVRLNNLEDDSTYIPIYDQKPQQPNLPIYKTIVVQIEPSPVPSFESVRSSFE